MRIEYRNITPYSAPVTAPWTLAGTIAMDCEEWERRNNAVSQKESYLYLNECHNSKQNGMYQLILNGTEIWYGTLPEINAVVKTMIRLNVRAAGCQFGTELSPEINYTDLLMEQREQM